MIMLHVLQIVYLSSIAYENLKRDADYVILDYY